MKKQLNIQKRETFMNGSLQCNLAIKMFCHGLDSIKKMNLLDGAPEGATPSSVKRIIANRYELTNKLDVMPLAPFSRHKIQPSAEPY